MICAQGLKEVERVLHEQSRMGGEQAKVVTEPVGGEQAGGCVGRWSGGCVEKARGCGEKVRFEARRWRSTQVGERVGGSGGWWWWRAADWELRGEWR